MQIEGIRIPWDVDQPMELLTLERGDISVYQRVVQGLFDVVDLERPPASLYFNDEGKLIGLPPNQRATLLMWLHNTRFIGHDLVVGDAFLIGGPDRQGNTATVPDELKRLLLDSRVFDVEVKEEQDDEWVREPMRFNDWTMAYGFAVALLMEHPALEHSRVVPVI
jgi:hypothetical protein